MVLKHLRRVDNSPASSEERELFATTLDSPEHIRDYCKKDCGDGESNSWSLLLSCYPRGEGKGTVSAVALRARFCETRVCYGEVISAERNELVFARHVHATVKRERRLRR